MAQNILKLQTPPLNVITTNHRLSIKRCLASPVVVRNSGPLRSADQHSRVRSWYTRSNCSLVNEGEREGGREKGKDEWIDRWKEEEHI